VDQVVGAPELIARLTWTVTGICPRLVEGSVIAEARSPEIEKAKEPFVSVVIDIFPVIELALKEPEVNEPVIVPLA
jgi:hypothetical protein